MAPAAEDRTGIGVPDAWVTVARIVKPHGLAGAVTAELFTDHARRFAGVSRVFLCREGQPPCPFPLLQAQPHQDRVVLRLEGIDDLAAAQRWAGAEVRLPAAERLAPPPGRYLISDLTGCAVWDRGRRLGAVTAVTELPGAAPLLEIRGAGGEEILVPFAAAYLQQVDAAARLIEMRLPAGMAELNPLPKNRNQPDQGLPAKRKRNRRRAL